MNNSQSVFSFNGKDARLEIAKGLPAIEQAITIEFWEKSGKKTAKSPSIIEAQNAQHKRVLNIYFPWENLNNSRMVWDAGNEQGYNRIHKQIKANHSKKVWTHWAFVKDASTGQMSIYQNGKIWYQQGGNYKSLSGIDRLVIGSSMDGLRCWKGLMCEFRIWQTARSNSEIKTYMKRRLTGKESDLLVYYPLNNNIEDKTGHGHTGIIQGELIWQPSKVFIEKTAKKSKKFIIKSKSNDCVLDVAGGDAKAGTNILLYSNNCGLNQKWTFTSDGVIKSLLGNYALDLQDIPNFEWAKTVVINPVSGAKTQAWKMSPNGAIQNKSNNFALAVVQQGIYDVIIAYPIDENDPKLTEQWELVNWRS